MSPVNLTLHPELSLLYLPDVVCAPAAVFAALASSIAWDTRMRARKTACFGVPYDYSGMRYAEQPMPPQLDEPAALVERHVGARPNSCLVNLYEDGQARMGFHVDSEAQLVDGAGVTVISLGSARTLVFRKLADRGVRVGVRLASGSLLHMPRASQRVWQHGVPGEGGASPRMSCTFRQLAPRAL